MTKILYKENKMKKLVFGALALAAAMSLNAAVVATVNGQEITDDVLNRMVAAKAPGATYAMLNADQKKNVLDTAIDAIVIAQEAIKSGIEKDKEYQEALENVKLDIARGIWLQKQYEATKVPAEEIKKFYDNNTERFMRKQEVCARHILIQVNGTDKGADDKAKAKAESIIKSLSGSKELSTKFADAAKKESNEPGASQTGGELGCFADNQMVKEFSDAAFALKKGEMSKTPVKTRFGYHIIYVEDIKPAGKVDFADVDDQIEGMLKSQEFAKKMEAEAANLRKKAKIDIKK
jgi:peptidylprolyl isomerase